MTTLPYQKRAHAGVSTPFNPSKLLKNLQEAEKKICLDMAGVYPPDVAPHLVPRYVETGHQVLFIAAFHASAAAFAATYAFGSPLIGIPIGLTWARGFVLPMEKKVLSIPKTGKETVLEKMMLFMPRAAIGIGAGVLIALPITVKIFLPSIAETQIQELQSKNTDLSQELKELRPKRYNSQKILNSDVEFQINSITQQMANNAREIHAINSQDPSSRKLNFVNLITLMWKICITHPEHLILHLVLSLAFAMIDISAVYYRTFVLPFDSYDHAAIEREESRKIANLQRISNEELGHLSEP